MVALLLLVGACATAEPAPGSPAGAAPSGEMEVADLESLTVEWSCYRGFWVSNEDQTIALHLRFTGDGTPQPEVSLPHPDWDAHLVRGTDLHANWCDDVLEPGEPTPVEDSRLEVVSGELSILGNVPEEFGGGGGLTLAVDATDLMVELSDGTETLLGSRAITNSSWGLIPG